MKCGILHQQTIFYAHMVSIFYLDSLRTFDNTKWFAPTLMTNALRIAVLCEVGYWDDCKW